MFEKTKKRRRSEALTLIARLRGAEMTVEEIARGCKVRRRSVFRWVRDGVPFPRHLLALRALAKRKGVA